MSHSRSRQGGELWMMLNHHDECPLWSIVDRGFLIGIYYWSCLIFYEGDSMLYTPSIFYGPCLEDHKSFGRICFPDISVEKLFCSLNFSLVLQRRKLFLATSTHQHELQALSMLAYRTKCCCDILSQLDGGT
jgi:hypothetical protein